MRRLNYMFAVMLLGVPVTGCSDFGHFCFNVGYDNRTEHRSCRRNDNDHRSATTQRR
jgi:hypothetical protein